MLVAALCNLILPVPIVSGRSASRKCSEPTEDPPRTAMDPSCHSICRLLCALNKSVGSKHDGSSCQVLGTVRFGTGASSCICMAQLHLHGDYSLGIVASRHGKAQRSWFLPCRTSWKSSKGDSGVRLGYQSGWSAMPCCIAHMTPM